MIEPINRPCQLFLARIPCLLAGVLAVAAPVELPAFAQSLKPASASASAPAAKDEDPLFIQAGADEDASAGGATRLSAGRRKPKAQATDEDDPLNPRMPKVAFDEITSSISLPTDTGRANIRTAPVDGLRPSILPESRETAGIRLGGFVLRPSLNTSVNSETTRGGGSGSTRIFGQTELKGTLTSDWSRHQLTVTGDGIAQKNLSGDGQTEPFASMAADLRLDLPRDTVAHLTGGYTLSRESATDPNAVFGATDQAAVRGLAAGASIERDFGLLRGLAALDLSRTTYSDVTLTDGSRLSLDDRDRNGANLRLRVGYELSPALIPFLEASAGKTVYDLDRDRAGYRRDMRSLGVKGGIEVDLGEKLKGELGLGYRRVSFADARLAAIDAVVLDASATWSPRRGTDITLGLVTSVEPSALAAQSGYVSRALGVTVTQQVRSDLLAKFTAGANWRDYRPSGTVSDDVVATIGTGVVYGLNRYVDLTGDISWERTSPDTGAATNVIRAGFGITLKR